MGQAIAAAIAAADDLQYAGTWDRGADLGALLDTCDVLVDFTLPEATVTVAGAAARHRVPLVCGVSGLGEEQLAALQRAAKSIPIVYDRNMSVGVAVLEKLVREAARALPGFDVEVRETSLGGVSADRRPGGDGISSRRRVLRGVATKRLRPPQRGRGHRPATPGGSG